MRLFRAGERGFERYLTEIEERGVEYRPSLERRVRAILRDVRERGDKAVAHYTNLYDGERVPTHRFEVGRAEVELAYRKIPRGFLKTLERASRRIRRFHRLSLQRSIASSERGIRLGQRIQPLERVGVYVPGGKASYPSTVLMAAIPARVAGVREILMVTPPQQRGGVNPAVLVAADLAGVDRIFRVGGVQAIAALAYGTARIPRVDKIVGPGNQYVAAAKRLVYGVVDVDMVAGPSEIVVVSDEKTPPSFLAADLISQAEHDEMALAILVTPFEGIAREVQKELKRQLDSLRRTKIARSSLEKRGAILIVQDVDQAIEVANRIAPEHLELSVSHPFRLLRRVRHAGAVFLGPYTPEAIGDYVAGPNHILPTAGTARFSSPLGVEDFLKRTNWMSFTGPALKRFDGDVRGFTEFEGLEGHYRALEMRVNR